jgi:GNAT superfamily N-acetyltransferase
MLVLRTLALGAERYCCVVEWVRWPFVDPTFKNVNYQKGMNTVEYEILNDLFGQKGCRRLIGRCNQKDEVEIFNIINESAKVYKGVIPEDRYHEPYMPLEELRKEMGKMTFFGYEEEGKFLGVAGFQPVRDVTLVRHTYVLPAYQRRGIGGKLLSHIKGLASTEQLLVGTWEAATWAISFYEKHGFRLLSNKDELLRRYWKIPERQIELSIVLGTNLADEPE